MSRTLLPVSLLIEEHGSIPKDAVIQNRRYISSEFNMSTLAVVQDEQHQRLEVKLRRELGDQVLRLLDDTLTEDILLNPDGSLWVKRMGHGFARVGEMPAAQAASALGTIAAWRGTVLNHEHPILETELPIDGSRFEGIVSPVVRRPVFAIRLRPRKIFSLDDYEADGILTDGTDPLNQLRRRDDFLDGVRGGDTAQPGSPAWTQL